MSSTTPHISQITSQRSVRKGHARTVQARNRRINN